METLHVQIQYKQGDTPSVIPHCTMWWNSDAVEDSVRLFSESQLYAAAIDKVWRRQIAEVAIRLAGWSSFFVSFGKAEIDKNTIYNSPYK